MLGAFHVHTLRGHRAGWESEKFPFKADLCLAGLSGPGVKCVRVCLCVVLAFFLSGGGRGFGGVGG